MIPGKYIQKKKKKNVYGLNQSLVAAVSINE